MAHRWFTLFLLLFALIWFLPIDSPSAHGVETAAAARWKNGDLVPPLPLDETVRAQALAQVDRRARAMLAAQPGVRMLPPAIMEKPAPASTPTLPGSRKPSRTRAASVGNTSDLQAVRRLIDESLAAAATPPATQTSDPVPTLAVSGIDRSPATGAGPQPGIDFNDYYPASPDISVGLNHVVIAAVRSFQVRDKCGNVAIDDDFGAYFGLDPSLIYAEPVTVYDEWSNRYLMVYEAFNYALSQFECYLAISTDESATTWYYYDIPFAAAGDLGDDISVAVSPWGIYLCGDEYAWVGGFLGATIIELDKATAYSGAPLTAYARRGLTDAIDALPARGVRPAQMHTFPGAVYFVNTKYAGGSSGTLFTLLGTPGSSSLGSANMSMASYTWLWTVQQPDLSTVEAGDCRVSDAVYDSGKVYFCFTVQNPLAPTRTTIRIGRVIVATVFYGGLNLSTPASLMFGALDIDDFENVGLFWNEVSTSEYMSAGFWIANLESLTEYDSGVVLNGLSSVALGGSPHRWGDHNGVTRDPADDHTFWMHAAYAYAPTAWRTGVYIAGGIGLGNLSVTPVIPLITSGVEGGPFTPDHFQIHLENTGPGVANWHIQSWPAWGSFAQYSGSLPPYLSQDIVMNVDQTAAASYSLGLHDEALIIENCSGSGGDNITATLAVGQDFNCPGTTALLFPLDTLPTLGSVTNVTPGVYFTPTENISVCAVGIYADIDIPRYANVSIYREGAGVIAGSTALLYKTEAAFHYFPIDVALEGCENYELVVSFPGAWSYPAFDELVIHEPLDVSGLVRVLDGAQGVDPSPKVLSPMFLVASSETCLHHTELSGNDFFISGSNLTRGNMVQPRMTHRICSVGVDMAAPVGTEVTANVVETSSGSLVAAGSAIVSSPGLVETVIPISALLVEGRQYDINVTVPGSSAIAVFAARPVPYVTDWAQVVSGSSYGGADPDVTDMTLSWSDELPGYPFDLSKSGAPPSSASGPGVWGEYITSLLDDEVYSLGIYADIPPNQTISARIYSASGTTRGGLITQGTITSVLPGPRW
ncbi:MAG TPA: hypothetical protein VFH88_01715, partial [Candidatus Krumholzibacteria bacterium]|nr:hypothetical protein [Candidatus Krumholzibacteria bacterium]